jgi:alkylhydroperoxidase/carboxymuconolactone decarboxylase family protein YurZ
MVEAAMVAVAFGGSPALACAATALKDALDEFGAV